MIVNVYDGDSREHGKVHSEVLVELFITVDKSSAVDQEERRVAHGCSLKVIDIESVLWDIGGLVNYVTLGVAVLGKHFGFKTHCVITLTVFYEELSLLLCCNPLEKHYFKHPGSIDIVTAYYTY